MLNLSLITHSLYLHLRVHDGFICYLHYVITIRLLYDNYVIHIPYLSLDYAIPLQYPCNTVTTPLPLRYHYVGITEE